MRMTTVIVLVAVVAIVALVLIARGGGPRVTHIETRRKDEDREDDNA